MMTKVVNNERQTDENHARQLVKRCVHAATSIYRKWRTKGMQKIAGSARKTTTNNTQTYATPSIWDSVLQICLTLSYTTTFVQCMLPCVLTRVQVHVQTWQS